MIQRVNCPKSVLALLLTCALAFAVSACGSDGDSSTDTSGSSGSAGADNFTVGYSTTGGDQFQAVEQEEAVKQIEEQGMTALEPVSANKQAGKQLSDIQALVAQGANAMIIIPADSAAIKPAIDQLNSEDIPSVTIDISPEGARVAMVVRANNERMGEDACKRMGAALKGEGTVLAMQGDFKTTNGLDRAEGFKKCMGAEFPDIDVIDQQTNWLPEKAAEIANTQLTTNPDIDAIYMASDTIMLSPVLAALKSVGRDAKVGQPGHVFLASIDGSPYGLKMVREGNLDMLVSQPLNLYAKYGVQYVKEAAEGKTFKPGPTDHESEIIEEAGNLQDLVIAPVVTKENASDPTLWGNSVN